jgi:sulfonate transport system permease protein
MSGNRIPLPAIRKARGALLLSPPFVLTVDPLSLGGRMSLLVHDIVAMPVEAEARRGLIVGCSAIGREFTAGLRGLAWALILPVSLIVLWSIASDREWISEQILPAPYVVWDTARELIATGQLQSELLVSVGRIAAGLLAGGAAGIAFGAAAGLSPRTEAYAMPLVRAVWSVPTLGWLPVCMLVFGIGETLKIFLIAKACFLPLMVNSFESARNVSKRYRDVARLFELSRLDTLRLLIFPSMLPAVLTGLRLALSKGWQVLVLVEMIASAAGIGYLMTWGRKSFQLDVVLATMIVIGVVGWLFDRGTLMVQERATAWTQRSLG